CAKRSYYGNYEAYW
nr:immunoglobulin heavy chain junction region [Mus musculus]MBK4198540.1 immunoglobulin heavy chain junction region [Mus musculus]MBK4198541.1 immunoglobulin heavy chain junction region [Mus musculus]MBK4198542.1 immunoglobulin heavy chain junction region [Mus musculus]MBK4198543.1 immunoglobulin heavy chain junction region [Mus musculus]